MDENLLLSIMGVFFAFSAMQMAISQSFDNQATNLLINSLITFEQKSYLEDMSLNLQLGKNDVKLSQSLDLTSRSMSCSLSSLSQNLGDPQITRDLLRLCSDSSAQETYIDLEVRYNNLSKVLANISAPISPLDTLSSNLDKYFEQKRLSTFFQLLSLSFLVLGFVTFFYVFLHKQKRLRSFESST